MTDFSNLTPGDEIGIVTRYGFRIAKVERQTKIHVAVDGKRYHKITGHLVGDNDRFFPESLAPADEVRSKMEELRKKIARNNRERIMLEVRALYRITDAEIPATLRRIADEIEGEKAP